MNRAIGVLMVSVVLMLGCVDTDELTGPAPKPPGDEGELTSTVVSGADAAEQAQTTAARRPEAPR